MGGRAPARVASALTLALALAWLLSAAPAAAGVACGSFHRVPTPSPGTLASEVDAVAAASPHAAWAVGNWSNSSKEGGLILRFHGSTWSVQRPPGAAGAVQLQAVDALNPNDVWAVGQRLVHRADGSLVEHTITLHWNGVSWSRIASPNVGTHDNSLYGVVATAHDDVWAVGDEYVDLDRTRSLILHWNGASWSVVPGPNPGAAENYLSAVAAGSANDVWAVGERAPDTSGVHGRTLAVHWNGSAWSVVHTPFVGADNHLFGVAVIGPNSAWAVGSGSGGGRMLAERWNGHAWKVVDTPDVSSDPTELDDVAVVSPTSVWAIGDVLTGGLGIQSLALRWNGSAWHEVPVEQVGASETGLGSIARIPGTNRLWAAGESANSDTSPQRTLVEQGC